MALKGCSFANSPVRDRTICATRVRWPRRKSSKKQPAPSLPWTVADRSNCKESKLLTPARVLFEIAGQTYKEFTEIHTKICAW